MALVKKNQKLGKRNHFRLTKKDLIGDLNDFPLGIVVYMLEEQEIQGNKPDVTVFQRLRASDQSQGGFTWSDTEDGHDFWSKVIDEKNFDLFFEEYPEYKRYN